MDWYNDLNASERAVADAFLKMMRKMDSWGMPNYRPSLSGNAERRKLGELRWLSGNVQHRLIGYIESKTFVAMIGCTHKQTRYDPPDALDTAESRRKLVKREEATTNEFEP